MAPEKVNKSVTRKGGLSGQQADKQLRAVLLVQHFWRYKRNRLKGWHKVCGDLITLGKHRLVASHDDEHGEECDGVCMSAVPLPYVSGFRAFEVSITETRNDWPDGLTVGVTTDLPGLVPQTADGFASNMVWLLGFDGKAFEGQLGKWETLETALLADLVVGDRVIILIAQEDSGTTMALFVNYQCCANVL